jgi:P pilus assembly chaperone PapD
MSVKKLFVSSLLLLCLLVPLGISAQEETTETGPDSAPESSEAKPSASQPTPTPSPTPTPVIAPPTPISLTVSPPTLYIDTEPGQPIEETVRVFNNGESTEILTTSLMTFSAAADGKAPVLRPFEPDEQSQEWLTMTPAEFSLEPQKWQTIKVSFHPPQDASLSYYYALLISRKGSVATSEGESAVIGAPAILVLSKVKTPFEKQELQLVSFASKRKVYEYLPATFTVEVKNTGNVHLAPVGNIFIDDAKKRDLGTLELNRTLGVILPNSTRTYTLEWNDGFPRYVNEVIDGAEVKDEHGNPKKKLEWDFSQANKFRFGKFRAHLIFIYDDGQRDVPTEAIVSFWVIPWKILGVFGLIFFLTLMGLLTPIILLLRRRKKKTEPHKKTETLKKTEPPEQE